MTADSSVLISAYSPWHDHHDQAHAATEPVRDVVAHAELEAYSVLTRMPAPLRAPADLVGVFLAEEFPGERLVLPEPLRRSLVTRMAHAEIAAGAVYDALIGLTAAEHGLTLLTLDRRAERVYARLGVPYELIDG